MNQRAILDAALLGGGAVAFGMVAVCFLRFWRKTRIRLFFLFAFAFLLLTAERVVLLLVDAGNPLAPYGYTIRLAAFGLIIIAIIDQNRSGSGPSS